MKGNKPPVPTRNSKAKTLLRKYATYLDCECRKVRIPGYDVEDLKQEVAIQLFESFEEYNPQLCSEKYWALKIIRNRLYTLWRQEARKKRTMYDSEGRFIQFVSLDDVVSSKSHGGVEKDILVRDMIPSENYMGECEFYENPDDVLYYKQLVKKVHDKLSHKAQLVFEIKLDPPLNLFCLMMDENTERLKKKKERGIYTRQVTTITNDLISKYMGIPVNDVKACLEEIRLAISGATSY